MTKLNIQKTKIMASGPITSRQIDGKTVETVRDFILGGSKITADFDYSHELKRGLFLGRKVMNNRDSILEEGNGNPPQYSSLQSPMDRIAWWAPVHRVTQGQTRLKSLNMHACIGVESGSPIWCSCLENPRDRGAWRAAVYGVTQSWTHLK